MSKSQTPDGKGKISDETGDENSYAGSPTAGHRPESIADALTMLDEALRRDGTNLRDLAASELAGLRATFESFAPKLKDQVKEAADRARGGAEEMAGEKIEQGRRVLKEADRAVRSNPWPLIGGAAFGALALGFLFGRQSSKRERES